MKMRLLYSCLLFVLFAMNVQDVAALHRIPTLYIQTKDGQAITSRDVWKDGTGLKLVLPDGYTAYESVDVAVKSRGHSTFTKPKKPYVFKLPAKQGLLGMPPARKWILLANFMDHSNVRNSLALEISRCTSLGWTPSWRFVDVFLNGKLQGLYLLVEAVEVKKQRLNLDTDKGFLLECDSYEDDTIYYTAHKQLPYHIKYPDPASSVQQKAISDRLNKIEDMLYGGNKSDLTPIYNRYIDLNSFVDWWIVHELTQNAEPNGPRSCYMYDKGDGRLRMGPVWDFDLAFITVGLDDGGDIRPARFKRTDVRLLTGDSIYNGRALWYGRLLTDSVFKHRLAERWKKLKPHFEGLCAEMEKWRMKIEPSAKDNDALWKGQDPARFDTYNDFEDSFENLIRVYRYRLAALDRILR